MQSIPVPTDALAKYFQQPHSSSIAIDDECAVMCQSAFDALLNYATSYPSASYVGKMWRSGMTLVFIGADVGSPNGLRYLYRNILILI